jgi:pimeloyl-ACP methyl ester carboxylesterase
MNPGRLSQAVVLILVGLLPSAVEAVVITDPVEAPVEPCRVDLPRHFLPPPALLDCDPRLDAPASTLVQDPNCARLIAGLRGAAQSRDATEILVRAALEYYVLRRPELGPLHSADPLVAQALADLAVTGQAAYESFRRLAPGEAAVAGPLQQRLLAAFPAHAPVPRDVSGAVLQALNRSHQVAWALRGPTPYRTAQRDALGWIAVSGEDDPPHRPVNMPSAPFPQYNMTVRVGAIDVVTRYMVASRHILDDHPADVRTIPPDREHPLIIGDVVVFIHGHSSSVEEAVGLAGALLAEAEARGRPVTLIAMDLPTNGYASMIEHTTIAPSSASRWNSGYPILEFIEDFVVAFVDGLEARQPGIKGQIVGVIGGSLGGNMTLRLGRRDPAAYPWLRNVVSWSPASTWMSWARETFRFFEKFMAVSVSREWMNEAEGRGSLHKFFHGIGGTGGRVDQAGHWYSKSWPCRDDAATASHRALYEIYNERFRRWNFRVAHEQLIFSHWDSDIPDHVVGEDWIVNRGIDPDPRVNPAAGPARYSQIRSRLLLAAGYDDDFNPEKLFTETRGLAEAMTMVNGTAFFVKDTGHSIHAEKPAFFARRILDFLFATPPPPFPAFLVPATSG